jgi:hypothetical protein
MKIHLSYVNVWLCTYCSSYTRAFKDVHSVIAASVITPARARIGLKWSMVTLISTSPKSGRKKKQIY